LSNLDEALERFQICGVSYGVGFANHGPMAAEALEVLGHAALIPTLVDVYAPRLPDLAPGKRIPPPDRAGALGERGRTADWIATFETLIEVEAWRSVLTRWLPVLLPGYFAAGTHGPLRTAHAVRALEREETAPRRRELAFGLGYWSSYYECVAGTPGEHAVSGRGPRETLELVEPIDPARRVPGLLSDGVRALEREPGLRHLLGELDPAALPESEFISELCQTAAALYLVNPDARIAYAHCVTSASALRILLPHLSPDDRWDAVGRVLQAAVAIHATQGRVDSREALKSDVGVRSDEVLRVAESIDEIRYRAACSVEEHAIKLSEACLRENAICPDPLLRLAAADAALEMGASRASRG
jgi:hypothetical protein